jgi:hypothetical protein
MVSIGSILLNKLHGVGFSPEGKQPKQLKSPWAILSLRVLLLPPYLRGMERKKYKRKRSAVPIHGDLYEKDLIVRIKLFRKITGESIADFGKNAAGDTKLWYELLAGRHLEDSTRERIFIYLHEKMRAFNSTMTFITKGNLNG